jgi:DNA gyrase subunit A
VTDDPCGVLLSSTGLLARTSGDEPLGSAGSRAKHDVVVSAARATARGQVGAVTNRGRLIRLDVLDLPALPATANAPHLQGGAPAAEFIPLESGERVLCLTTLELDSPGLALGTARGVVKRVAPGHLTNKDSWDIVRLADHDEVVGAIELRTGEEELVFITSDAQLLRFPAAGVRPQGRGAGGVSGIRVGSRARVVFFGAVASGDPDPVVVSVSGSSTALPGTEAGAVKVTRWAEYPAKGRGTSGVRCHRFLKGEDAVLIGWAGPSPARAAAGSGSPVDLPKADDRRDGSGTPAAQPIASIGGPITHL